ncbi:hypothetical protein ACFO5R_21535 [Halosolutus amylolyticus]|uniref:DUF2207 domain-containing protein n=1 Tax=Halosolutus amylolyticus TaxID=2932267 RepID=A0ABD5PVJ4_9EURY|nr:hypothetical protein [Halosolutus amylolyticus]
MSPPNTPSRRSARRLGIVVLIALGVPVASAGLAVGAYPPLSVCGVCDSIDGASDAGTLDVHVDEHGDSHWIARVPVTESAAETYRTNQTALEAAVDEGWYRYDVAIDDARNVDASIEDGTVRVAYTVADVAESGVDGGWVFDYLYAGGTRYRYDLLADRVTIHAPDGARVTNSPPNARVEDGSVTWTSDDGIASKTYVTYGPSGVSGTLASWGTAGVVYGPLVLSHGLRAGLAPIAIVGLATVAAGRLGGGRWGVAGGAGRTVGDAGRRGLDRVCTRFDRSLDQRTLAGVAVGTAALLCAVSWLAFGLGQAILLGTFGVATAAFLPLGHALERDESAWRFGLLAVAAPLAATIAFAPYYAAGLGPSLAGLLFVPWAIGIGVVGYWLSLVGRRVGGAESESDPG